MKKGVLLFLFIVQHFTSWAQIGLPVQQSVLPKNSLVVNYDFSKTTSYLRGATTVTNSAGTGNANLIGTPKFHELFGFYIV